MKCYLKWIKCKEKKLAIQPPAQHKDTESIMYNVNPLIKCICKHIHIHFTHTQVYIYFYMKDLKGCSM